MYDEFYRWVWSATIKRADKDLDSRNNGIRNDALRWILADVDDINSFKTACFYLGFKPEELRDRILEKHNLPNGKVLKKSGRTEQVVLRTKNRFGILNST